MAQEENMVPASEFTGGVLANFGRNFVVCFVSLITLGLAYPAMYCWKHRWEAENTYIDGRRLEFDGRGLQLFGSWLLWIVLTIVTLGIYGILCLPLNMQRWFAKHTHFEGEAGVSEFDGHIWQYFGVRFVAGLVTLITLGLGSFWATCYLLRWETKHTVYDGKQLVFEGTGMQYFVKRIVWLLLTVVTLGIYGLFFLPVRELQWQTKHTHLA